MNKDRKSTGLESVLQDHRTRQDPDHMGKVSPHPRSAGPFCRVGADEDPPGRAGPGAWEPGALVPALRLDSHAGPFSSAPRPLPPRQAQHSQAVHDRAPVPALRLPSVHLGQQAQEGLLGVRRVPVRGPAQELEVPHQQVPLLQLGVWAASRGDMSTGVTRPPVTSRRSLRATPTATPLLTLGPPDHSPSRCSAPGRHGPPSLRPLSLTQTPPP